MKKGDHSMSVGEMTKRADQISARINSLAEPSMQVKKKPQPQYRGSDSVAKDQVYNI